MKRLVALTLKDLAQHGWAVGALALFLPLAWGLLILAVLGTPTTVTYFEAHLGFTRVFVTVTAIILGNRLVVSEYHGRTQLYLESLPIGRFDAVIVKWIVGATVVLGVAATSLVATAAVASSREPIELPFVTLIAARTALFGLVVWSYFFVMGFLGRARIPVYLATGVGLALLARATDLELARFGPFAMVSQDMVLERSRWPVPEMLVTLAITVALIALAAALASVREGSLAETLAKPMSQREKVAIGISVVAILVAWGKLDPPAQREPFDFPDHHVARSATLPIEVYYADDALRADGEALVARLERELPPLRDALGWDALPPVHVMMSERLDGTTIEPVAVGEDDGVAVRARFVRGPEWDEDAFIGEIVGLVIDDHTDGRSYWEPYGWLRDGLAEGWPYRDRELPRSVVLRALFATRSRAVDPARLRRWDLWREREGFEATEALAATGVRALNEARGRDAVLALARDVFGPVPPDDARPVIEARLRPMPARVREHLGIDELELTRTWTGWVAARRSSAPPELVQLARAEASIGFEPSAEGLRDLVARVRTDAPLPAGTTVSLLHLGLGPFERDVWPWEPAPEDRAWSEGAREMEIRVPGRYGPGDRVWAAIDARLPEAVGVGAPLRLAYVRMTAREGVR